MLLSLSMKSVVVGCNYYRLSCQCKKPVTEQIFESILKFLKLTFTIQSFFILEIEIK